MKKRVAYVIFIMIMLSTLPFYSMIVKAQDGGEEDFEDDTPGSNPTEPWYTFTEEEGGAYGSVSDDNEATWTQTFEVDTSDNAGYEYTGYMEFNNSTYARISFEWRVNHASSDWLSRIHMQNGSALIAGLRNRDGTTLEAYTDGDIETVSGFTFQEDFWYDMQLDFNWTTDEYHIYINDTNYGWYEYYSSGDQINRLYMAESSTLRKGHFWVDDILVNDTTTGTVTTNGTTGVEEVNATMWGYLGSGVGSNHYVWFQYGLTVNYGSNTSSYIRLPGDEFSRKQGGLSRGTLYHYRAVAEPTAGGDQLFGFDRTFSTKPNPPSSFYVNATNDTILSLSWTAGDGAVNTVVSRNTSGVAAPPSAPDDGTIIYNGTGTSCTDTGLNPCVNYSYAIWSWAIDKYSDSNQTGYNYTNPSVPTNVDGALYDTNINITWTMGVRSNYTLVRRNSGSYPDNETDGTEVYNDTGTYVNTTVAEDDFFSLWAYNNTINRYSSKVNLVEGGLLINCYDEDNLSALTFSVFVSNQTGTETYEEHSCTNTHVIDIENCPTGDRIIVIINSSQWDGYDNRTYYVDLYEGSWYTINAFLPPHNLTNLYYLYVIDEANQPIDDVYIRIMQYINETFGFENITTTYTDGYGRATVWLQPNLLHKAILSKTDYQTEISDFITASATEDYYFQLNLEPPEYYNESTYEENINFTGYINSTGYVFVNYTDSLSETTSTNICIYETNTTTGIVTTLQWDNRTGNNSFTFNVSADIYNCYEVVLILDHQRFGNVTDGFIVCGLSRPYVNITNATWFNTLFNANYGTSPGGFGWSNLFGFFVLLAGVFSFGQRNSGVALLLTGGLLLFINVVIGLNDIGTTIPVLFIILGVLVQWANHRREALG